MSAFVLTLCFAAQFGGFSKPISCLTIDFTTNEACMKARGDIGDQMIRESIYTYVSVCSPRT